jgi:hypothetical protein
VLDSLARPIQADGLEQSIPIRERHYVHRKAIIVVAMGGIGVYFVNEYNINDAHDDEACRRTQVGTT